MTEHRVDHVDQPHGHPTEAQYMVVALILAILTLAEVGVYYLKSLPDDALIGMLGVLAVVKFSMVVLYFMHLKFDNRIFRRFFVTGLVLALAVYLIVLNTFHVFRGGIPRA